MATPQKKSVSIPSPAAPERFWPARVAESLGITVKRLAVFRKKNLVTPEHFVMEGNAPLLTAAGVARVKELLAAEATPPPAAIEPATAKETIPAGPPRRAKMVVQRVPPNKRLLLCARTDDPKKAQVLVRISTNENFMPGMTFEAVEGWNNLWQYTGRLPRRKGRY